MRGSDLDRLLRAAGQCDEPGSHAPFGFDTRVVALWRGSRGEVANRLAELTRLVRRIAISAAIVTVISGVGAYWQLSANDEEAEPLTNTYAIADTAIETGIFQ